MTKLDWYRELMRFSLEADPEVQAWFELVAKGEYGENGKRRAFTRVTKDD